MARRSAAIARAVRFRTVGDARLDVLAVGVHYGFSFKEFHRP